MFGSVNATSTGYDGRVNLKFEENVYTQSGKRLFNVVINGQQVLTNFDIFGAAGAQFQAVDVPIPVTVTTGQISIQFIPLVNVAGIFGIEIVAGRRRRRR